MSKGATPDVRYKVTLDQIARFEQALKELNDSAESEDPILDPPWRELQKQALESQLADLRAEAAAFEAVKEAAR